MDYSLDKTIQAHASAGGESHDVAPVRDDIGKEPMHVAMMSRRHGHERVLKGIIDIFGSFVMVILLSPLILLLWLLVFLVDGSPVIYRRRVVGVRGEFDAYKFRTMHRDADAMLAADPALHNAFRANFKLKSDPRVTRLGSWLRKYSLDELPQLFNVLKGQMSLVGPRMISAAELQRYGSYKALLMSVKPGVTGYWQVRGRQDLTYTERIRMDVHYIMNWSLALDLMILLQTPAKVLRSEGAY